MVGAAESSRYVMAKFRVMEESVRFAAACSRIAQVMRKRGDAGLAGQLSRAADSVALNVAEGQGFRGARRTNHYRIALGSGREAVTGIRLAIAKGQVSRASRDVACALDKANFICGALYKLTR